MCVIIMIHIGHPVARWNEGRRKVTGEDLSRVHVRVLERGRSASLQGSFQDIVVESEDP